MEYMSAKDASEKWKITIRQVQKLCASGRIMGAKRLGGGKIWMIPADSDKPFDGRKSRDSERNNLGRNHGEDS